MKSNKHIPLRHHKVLLLQLAHEIIERVEDTGLKPSSKRANLSTRIQNGIKQLEREFKRDVTLKDSAEAKRELFMELYEGVVPNWLLECMFGAYTEESRKLTKRSA